MKASRSGRLCWSAHSWAASWAFGPNPRPIGMLSEDPFEAQPVVRIVEQAEDGEHVLDFLAFVEAHAADDAVGDVGDAERFFQHAALGGRAVHDRDVGPMIPRVVEQAADFADDELRLVVLVGQLPQGNRFAFVVLGPDPRSMRWVLSRISRSAACTMCRVER